MGGMTTEADKAKLFLTLATALYVAWIVADLFLPLAYHVQIDAHYVVQGVLAVATRGAIALALRSVALLVVDRLAPPASKPPPG